MGKRGKLIEDPAVEALFDNPDIFEEADLSCADEEITELEDTIGRPLPGFVSSLLKVSDGGLLQGPHNVIHLASKDQLLSWSHEGAIDSLGAFPFAHDGFNTVFVLDTEGEWGGAEGAVYRLELGRQAKRHNHMSAIRVAENIGSLLKHLVAGKDPW